MDKITAAISAAKNSPLQPDDTQVIEREGWYQVISREFKEVSDNQIIQSLVKDSEVDQRIDETFACYIPFNSPFKWSIGPMSSPLIENKIAKRASQFWDFRGMTIDSKTQIPFPTDVEIELVTEKNFEDFLNVAVAGWKMEKFLEQSKKKFRKVVGNPNCRHFIARKNGEAIASAGLTLKEGHGYLIGGVVLPEHRGSGAYRTLIQKRLDILQEMGFSFAVTHAMGSTSAPILEKLGFETVFTAKSYRFDP